MLDTYRHAGARGMFLGNFFVHIRLDQESERTVLAKINDAHTARLVDLF